MRIPRDQIESAARAINEVVGYYARRTRHWYDERDLVQRAWVVIMETLPGWDPARGPIVPYLASALRKQLGNELVHDHSPVSASRAERYALYSTRAVPVAHGVNELSARAPTEAPGRTPTPASSILPEATVEPPRWTDEVLADERWHARVTSRLMEVVGEDGQEGLADLLREGSREGGSKAGRPPDRVARSRAVVLVRVAQDPELRELLAERRS